MGKLRDGAVEGEGCGGFDAVGTSLEEDGLRAELVEVIEGLEDLAEGWFGAEAGVVDEDDGAAELIFLSVEGFVGELRDVDDAGP